MHRQVSSLLSTNSPGRLAKLGSALGARKIDIATTGGAEWKHLGPVTLTIKDDWGAGNQNALRGFAEVMAEGGHGDGAAAAEVEARAHDAGLEAHAAERRRAAAGPVLPRVVARPPAQETGRRGQA